MHFRVAISIGILLLITCLFSTQLYAEWEEQDSGVNDNLYGVHFLTEETGYAVGWGASTGAVILKTTNGGEDWESSVPFNNTLLFSITFIDEDKGYAAGWDGGVNGSMLLETTDGETESELDPEGLDESPGGASDAGDDDSG